MLADMIEREVLIEASRERVWTALTDRVNIGAYRAVVKRAEQRTVLRVVETGFVSLHATEAEQAKAVQDNTERWQSELAELKDHAEQPAG